MTFCLGIKVADGLVGIADTRITSGSETITARKLTVVQGSGQSMFIMTSGLRSLRDKAITYFEELLAESGDGFDKLYQAVNALADQVRRVASEDKRSLADSNLPFNLNALVGGQLRSDSEPKLYMLYPQGNWVEVSHGSPYLAIGESAYGKPLLDRMLRYDTSMSDALAIGYLAFDAARTSASTVGFPIDVVAFKAGADEVIEHRFEASDLASVSDQWQDRLRTVVAELPSDWLKTVFEPPTSNVAPLSGGASGG